MDLTRAVVTVATGNPRYLEQAVGLARSLSIIGDSTPRILVTDRERDVPKGLFERLHPPPEAIDPYLLKLVAWKLTGAAQSLFIDSDSFAFRRLERTFSLGQGSSVAARGTWITEGDWYGDVQETRQRFGLSRIPMLNGGLIYFDADRCKATVDRALEIAKSYETSGLSLFRGKIPDEPCLALAMASDPSAKLWPDESDVMNTGAGLIGPMRLRMARNECSYLQRGWSIRHKRPDIFHAADYVKFYRYWRAIRELEKLANTTPKDRINAIDRWVTRLRYGKRW